ncbi:hypothetical protein ymoll0001_26420 [Yersinia mollaretii ATCC 43969]|uniref:Tryptophanase leader peptide n=1 Tax=Yersinia mollaretii (strain ATCC 43969 / DSM 18520 / CIP 103324 / CNY 7263 / WAIP 204) TaxID=349967 RepID=A0ABM9YBA7_YERMW|nr:hypothetical protein ymoll0001_26420 [Yersinia mollaretii ATCC 43969]
MHFVIKDSPLRIISFNLTLMREIFWILWPCQISNDFYFLSPLLSR